MLIQKNPLTMVGTIAQCWLFVYQTPSAEVRRLIPPQLELVQHRDSAFWNIVVCQVQNMRPKLSPLPIGVTYWHIAYRLYVRFRSRGEETIEGLYFLRSDCNNSLMSAVGNVLTDFNFHTASISISKGSQSTEIEIVAPAGDAYARINTTHQPALSGGSAFDSIDEASRFLKYKPNGISVHSSGRTNVVHIDRDEKAWNSRLVNVEEARWSFFSDKNVSLEICYEVEPISYQWNRARIFAAVDRE